jgi:glycosyltransferase involved in cell wall biosynthesis
VYCVREDAAMSYRKRYPLLADRFSFTPTWVDTNLFRQPETGERRQRRREFLDDFGLPRDCFTLVTVGRLDKQKNPLLLVEAFAKLHARMPDIGLVFIGEGVLRGRIEDRVRQLGLEAVVKLAGAKPPMKVAEYLQGADLFVLSSGYEGMPISVLEALASGLPVTSTAVGEVPRAVHPGVNGELVSGHDADSLAGAIEKCRENAGRYRGDPAVRSIQDFTPGKVLQPIYENYRRLANAVREPSSDNSRP